MYQNQVQNKPTAAYWLSMIGGIIALLGGLGLIGLGAIAGTVSFGLGFAVIGGLGIWITLCSVIVIYAASKLNAEPLEHSKWGAIILVLSIIGSWSILNFIGGILALVYKPIMDGRTTAICTATTVRTTTSLHSASTTTAGYTNLPTMRTSSAGQRAFLPQLRQTTVLIKFKPKSGLAFWKHNFFNFLRKTKKEKKFRFSLL